MKKTLFIIILFLLSINNVNAEACDAYDIKRLKETANGVEITYELQSIDNLEQGVLTDEYKIRVNGLTEEINIYNKTDDQYYDVNTNFEQIILYGGTKIINIISRDCGNVLKSYSLKIPAYNSFYLLDECKTNKNKELDVCQQWTDRKYTQTEFFETINKNEEQTVTPINLFNNKVIIIVIVVILLLVIAYAIYHKKKVSLE